MPRRDRPLARVLRAAGCTRDAPARRKGAVRHLLGTTAPRVRPVRHAHEQPDPRWLFPGLTPGRPISEPGFKIKLRECGIAARPARNAALISLAADLPSPVLADLVGLSTGAAVKWAALAKRGWNASWPPALRISGLEGPRCLSAKGRIDPSGRDPGP